MKLSIIESDGGTINFSNGIQLDYDFTENDMDKRHMVVGFLKTIRDQATLENLLLDWETLQCIIYIKNHIPDAYLEVIYDGYIEYIFYLTDDQIHRLTHQSKNKNRP